MGQVLRVFSTVALLLAAGTVVGMVLLWPGDVEPRLVQTVGGETERATVEGVRAMPCSATGQGAVPPAAPGAGVPGPADDGCRRLTVRLDTGPDEGETTRITLAAGTLSPEIDVGDELRVARNADPAAGQGQLTESYSLTDFERRRPMLLLALLFAGLVLLFGRLRGALSLVGLGISLTVVLVFMVPAILDGKAPLLVAVVGSFAVMLATISLAHGTGPKSLAAMLGTGASLLLTVGLALLFTDLSHLTGLASEETAILQTTGTGVNLEGLLVAGMVIAALGVLDDVTISQASTVLALRAAKPAQSFGELFGRALRVGQDHVSATVNTLVLVYAGSSLPLLLIFSAGELPAVEAVNLEIVAKEVVAMLVGSIGLIAAMPITTALAALLSAEVPAEELAGAGHAH